MIAICAGHPSRSHSLVRPALLGLLFLGLLALSARPIALPGTAVPITAQTLVVLLAGAMLGPRLGAAVVGAYVLAGLGGAPIFAFGGGPAYVASPTAGYLVGFAPAAGLCGLLMARGWDRTLPRTAAALLLAVSIVYALGLANLALYVPARLLLAKGLLPFLPGEALKLALAGAAVTALRRW